MTDTNVYEAENGENVNTPEEKMDNNIFKRFINNVMDKFRGALNWLRGKLTSSTTEEIPSSITTATTAYTVTGSVTVVDKIFKKFEDIYNDKVKGGILDIIIKVASIGVTGLFLFKVLKTIVKIFPTVITMLASAMAVTFIVSIVFALVKKAFNIQ